MLKEMLENVRGKQPLVHCITNYVTANDCANLLLAAGASPIMADDPMEAEEIVSSASGLVINLGTPNQNKLRAMLLAGRRANELGRPVVFDPVGTAASSWRLNEALSLMESIRFSVIRANASEVRSLLEKRCAGGGLEAPEESEIQKNASELAGKTGSVVVMTGRTDVITDGMRNFRVGNGHALMRRVTGAGCQLSALAGAFAAANPKEVLRSSLAAACAMGVCGELAARRMSNADGNASFRNYLIDAMYRMTGEELEKEARYEEC